MHEYGHNCFMKLHSYKWTLLSVKRPYLAKQLYSTLTWWKNTLAYHKTDQVKSFGQTLNNLWAFHLDFLQIDQPSFRNPPLGTDKVDSTKVHASYCYCKHLFGPYKTMKRRPPNGVTIKGRLFIARGNGVFTLARTETGTGLYQTAWKLSYYTWTRSSKPRPIVTIALVLVFVHMLRNDHGTFFPNTLLCMPAFFRFTEPVQTMSSRHFINDWISTNLLLT